VVIFLVIMIVKSSIALSLGLVGALSIVRFRTPIKEPEELVYLFICIALGLGYGAGMPFITSAVFLVIMAIVILWRKQPNNIRVGEYNVMVDCTSDQCDLADILEAFTKSSETVELKKYVTKEKGFGAFIKIDLADYKKIAEIERNVKERAPKAILTFSEARTLQ